MLPIRLELRNFLAYRNPDPIPLQDLHLACLTGRNGAGKSSLLDAITWALWGKARSRSDDDLIHMGQDEMSVIMDFLQDGNQYRVIRERQIGKRRDGGRGAGNSKLTLFGWDADIRAFKPISSGVNETQVQINQLLRLTYELFVNSAFLQQGKADTFTTRTPTERKKILSDILGLDRWSLYEDHAKAVLNNVSNSIKNIEYEMERMELDFSREPGLQREFEEAKQQYADADESVNRAEASLDEVRGADKELDSARKTLISVQLNIRERKKDLEEISKDILRHENQLASFQQIMSEADLIRAGYQQLESARAADQELGDKLRALDELKDHITDLERQLNDARQQIELEVHELRVAIQKDDDIVQGAVGVYEGLTDLNLRIKSLEQLESDKAIQQEGIALLRAESAELQERNRALKEEMNSIRDRLDLLEAATAPECPVCGQPLDEEQRAALIEKMSGEGRERGDTHRANKAQMDAIADQIKALQTNIQAAERDLKELPSLQVELGRFEKHAKDADAAAEQIRSHQIKLTSLMERLDEGQFAEEIRVQLDEAYQRRDALGYDRGAHDEARQMMESYLGYQDQAKDLEFAEQSIPSVQEILQHAYQRRERNEKSLAENEGEEAACLVEIGDLEVKEGVMKLRQHELNQQRTFRRNAEEKVISVEQDLRSINNLRKRRIELIERKAQLVTEETIYDQLKNAFGRNGIPAMIIEAVIPELEDATNQLLSRMTSNLMHVRFDTQREKKAGGLIETLDILIADELGTRDYSLFSGGEAFRINFAIRIALSQLLARRAGAQLRTLFIDEGFGTQDDIGRERLVEAITAIQDDFDLILVITHIDDLKDAFPARLEVTKTATGSMAIVR